MNKFNQYTDSILSEAEASAWDGLKSWGQSNIVSPIQTAKMAVAGDTSFKGWNKVMDYENNIYTLYPAGKSEKIIAEFDKKVESLKKEEWRFKSEEETKPDIESSLETTPETTPETKLTSKDVFKPKKISLTASVSMFDKFIEDLLNEKFTENKEDYKKLTHQQFEDVTSLLIERRRSNQPITLQNIIDNIYGQRTDLKSSEEIKQAIYDDFRKDVEKILGSLSDDVYKTLWTYFDTNRKKTVGEVLIANGKKTEDQIEALINKNQIKNINATYMSYQSMEETRRRQRSDQLTSEQSKDLHNTLKSLFGDSKYVYYLTKDEYEKMKLGKVDAWGRIITGSAVGLAKGVGAVARGVGGVAKGIGNAIGFGNGGPIGVRQGP